MGSKQKKCLLIVDDAEPTRTHLKELFQNDYTVLEAADGLTAYRLLREHREITVAVLLDIAIPLMDGFRLMEQLQKEGLLEEIPVILIADNAFAENEIKGMALGACDIILKPFEPVIIKKRVENLIQLYGYRTHMEEIVREQTRKITENNNQIIDALSTVIEYRNMESGLHIRRIRVYTKALLRVVARRCPEYNLTQKTISIIASASAMHDIGKISIPDKVLLKPSKLTPLEFEIMKSHTTKGCEILQAFRGMEDKEYLKYCYEICRHHHERWDGRGYPDGLKEEEIPLCAQVVAIADVYDALTSSRVYKPAFSHETAVQMIMNGECGKFSSRMLECFREVSVRFRELRERYMDNMIEMGQEAIPEMDEMQQDEVMTKLHESSEALQKEMLQRDALINAIPGGVAKVALDEELTVLFASNGFYRMTGYGRSEFHEGVVEGKCLRLLLPEDVASMSETLRNQVRDGQRVGMELRLLRQDGKVVWVSLHGSVVEKENGVDVMQAVFIDTTEAKETEKKLLDLMNTVPGGIALIQIQAGVSVLYASDGFYNLTGHSRADFEAEVKNDVMRKIHQDDISGVYRQIMKVISSGRKQATLEYRVVCRDGTVRWHQVTGVRTEEEVRGQGALFRCVFTDVTESKAVQEQLKMNEERFRVIVEQVQDVIFEWDILGDSMYLSPAFERKFGYEVPSRNFQRAILEADIIHEEDKKRMREHFSRVMRGAEYDEFEMRLKSGREKEYLWCRVRAAVQFNGSGKPVRTVGVLSDIDAYKRENAMLEARTQRDLLTDLYNKTTFQSLVNEFLRGSGRNGRHAFFVLDIDNFKDINDRLGHARGDELLVEVTKGLREKFRGNDIIGRTGGDEFVILLKNTPSQVVIEKKVELICELFRTMSAREHGGEHFSVSGSLGIAAYPEDGTCFDDLFQHADQALYLSKHSGKNCFTFYTK